MRLDRGLDSPFVPVPNTPLVARTGSRRTSAKLVAKRIGWTLCSLISFASLVVPEARAAVTTAGSLSLLWATEISRAPERATTQQLEATFVAELEADLSPSCRFRAIARARFDEPDRIEPGRPDELAVRSTLSRRWAFGDRGEAELLEAYLACASGNSFLTLGKQQVVWGQADGLKVLDVVNPQSFRLFVTDELAESRIPLWTANLEINLGRSTLQLLWIPDRTYHQFASDGAVFAFSSPRFRPDYALRHLVGANNVQVESPVRPSGTLATDFGFRVSTFLGGWDLSLNGLRHHDAVPIFQRTFVAAVPDLRESPNAVGGLEARTALDLGVRLRPRYQQVDLLGATFSNAFGEWTVRGELAWTFDRLRAIADPGDPDGLAEADEIAGVVGVDWYGARSTLWSLQLFHQRSGSLDSASTARARIPDDNDVAQGPLDAFDLQALPFQPGSSTTLTGLYRRTFDGERHVLRLLWAHDRGDGDGWIQLRGRWSASQRLDLLLTADLFYGPEDGLFGQFDSRDRLRLGVSTSW